MPSTATEKWEQTASKPRSTSIVQIAKDHLTLGGRCFLRLLCRFNETIFFPPVHGGVNLSQRRRAPIFSYDKMRRPLVPRSVLVKLDMLKVHMCVGLSSFFFLSP